MRPLLRAARQPGRWLLLVFAVGFLFGFSLLQANTEAGAQAQGSNAANPYPNQGLFWLSQQASVPGWLYVSSNDCVNPYYNRIVQGSARVEQSSTIPSLYPNGINIEIYCANENLPPLTNGGWGQFNPPTNSGYFTTIDWWDVYMWWDPDEQNFCQAAVYNGCGVNGDTSPTIGGRNISYTASTTWCAANRGVNGACGVRGVVQLNKQRTYENENYTQPTAATEAQWTRTILHEYMHPFGMDDCDSALTGYSPKASCGFSQEFMQEGDRQGLLMVYASAPPPPPCLGVYFNDLYPGTGAWYGPYNSGSTNLAGTPADQRASAAWIYNGCDVTVTDWPDGGGWSDSNFPANVPGWNYYSFVNRFAWYNGQLYNMDNDVSFVQIAN